MFRFAIAVAISCCLARIADAFLCSRPSCLMHHTASSGGCLALTSLSSDDNEASVKVKAVARGKRRLGYGAALDNIRKRKLGASSARSESVKSILLHLNEGHVNSLTDVMAGNSYAANLMAPNMTVRIHPSIVNATCTHFRASSVRKPIVLAYGAPGAGKSAFAQTMADLINRYDPGSNSSYDSTAGGAGDMPSSSDGDVAWLKSRPAMHDVDDAMVRDFASASRDTLALVISFNGNTPIGNGEGADALHLGMPWLPVASRLLFLYFGSFRSRFGEFYVFYNFLVHLLERDQRFADYFVEHCCPSKLLTHLREAQGKAKIALYVDESMFAFDALTHAKSTAGQDFLRSITSLQDQCVSIFFTGLRSGPFLRASSASRRPLIPLYLPPISEDRHEEFFPPAELSRLIPSSVLVQSKTDEVNRACLLLSRYLFSLTAGYPRVVEILHRACLYSRTLPEVLSTAVAATRNRYPDLVTYSALALGALNVRLPRGLIVREELPSSDPVMREACRKLLRDVNSVDHAVPPGYMALDEMVSRGMTFIKDPGEELDAATPFVPPLNLLATFRDSMALADIVGASRRMSELFAEIDKENLKVNRVHALALAAKRRLELLPSAGTVPALATTYYYVWEALPFFCDMLTEFYNCQTKKSTRQLKMNVSEDIYLIKLLAASESESAANKSWVDGLCTLAADARGMVGDASILAMCQGLGSNEGYQSTIHEVNSEAIERWHARYECMMRLLYADADQYLPEGDQKTKLSHIKPDYSKRLLSNHYKTARDINYLKSAQFNWTEPLEMVLGASALPDCSDSNSLQNAKGKMLVMEGSFVGFELAWVAYRVDDEGESKPVLFLEQHKMQMGTGLESLSTLTANLKLALSKAKAGNWDPKDVVYVVKSTRPLPGGSLEGAVSSTVSYIMSNATLSRDERTRRAVVYRANTLDVWKSTNAVLLCGKHGLGEYLGPMLWSSLTAGDALGPVASSENGEEDDEEGVREEQDDGGDEENAH